MPNDFKLTELMATPTTFPQPVLMEPNSIFQCEVGNEFELLDWTSLSFFGGPPIENVLLSQPNEAARNFHEEGAMGLSTEVGENFVMMDLVDNGREVAVTELPIQLEVAYSPNGGEGTPVPLFYDDLHEVDASVQIQAGNVVPNDSPMDPQVQRHSEAPPITKEGRTFNKAEIAALLQEAEDLDMDNRANMPSEKPIDPPAGSGNNIPSYKLDESKEIKRLRKNAYSKRYRENKKAQRQKLERENAFHKQQLANSYKVIGRLQMRDAQLDSKILYLISA